MKRVLLTAIASFTILFAQSQCQANFSYIQTGPTTVFTDLSTMQSTNYSTTWQWDFGDGNTSTQQNPVHTYSNGIYSPCLIVTFFDSTIMNYCTSVYCDTILIGNTPPASWDCNPVNGGCFDPLTGLGQYSTLSSCQSICGNVTDSFACMVGTAPGITTCVGPGVYTMGQANVMEVYSTMAACIADSCNVMSPPASWDCSVNMPGGCYDPGNGMGQYTTLVSCQTNCGSTNTANYCDSMTLVSTGASPQTILAAEINSINTIIDYWITTAPDGTVLGEDSLWNTHQIFNINPVSGQPFDTINVCITYADSAGYYTCCVTWVWDPLSGNWAMMGSITSIGEINSSNKKLIKVVDLLGRETDINSNQTLFFIYKDGTIEKRYIIK